MTAAIAGAAAAQTLTETGSSVMIRNDRLIRWPAGRSANQGSHPARSVLPGFLAGPPVAVRSRRIR
jgi:hypothetical protein